MCIIQTVVVESNIFKAVTHAFALSFNSRVSTEGSCNGFFIVLSTSAVLRTLLRVCMDCAEVNTGQRHHPVDTLSALSEGLNKL